MVDAKGVEKGCTGVEVHSNGWILTSGSCCGSDNEKPWMNGGTLEEQIERSDRWFVGDYDKNSFDEGQVEYVAWDWYLHPYRELNWGFYDYDVCLVKLIRKESNAPFLPPNSFACLPEFDNHISANDDNPDGPECFIAGWSAIGSHATGAEFVIFSLMNHNLS